jgi:hypothetical protein
MPVAMPNVFASTEWVTPHLGMTFENGMSHLENPLEKLAFLCH